MQLTNDYIQGKIITRPFCNVLKVQIIEPKKYVIDYPGFLHPKRENKIRYLLEGDTVYIIERNTMGISSNDIVLHRPVCVFHYNQIISYEEEHWVVDAEKPREVPKNKTFLEKLFSR